MKHHIHAGDAQHGGVEVEAPEHLFVDVLPVGFQQVAGIVFVALFIFEGTGLAGMHPVEVFHGAGQETGGAAGRVTDDIGGLRVDQFHHGVDDVARGAELAVDAGGGEFAEQVFVNVAFHVTLGERQVIDHFHGGDQYGFVLDLQIGVLHVFADVTQGLGGTAFAAQALFFCMLPQAGEIGVDSILQVLVQLLAAEVLEVLPAQ